MPGSSQRRLHVWAGFGESLMIWRTLLSGLLITLGLLLGGLPMVMVLRRSESVRQHGFNAADVDLSALNISSPLYVALLLIPFASGMLALWAALHWLHGRKFITLLTGLRGRWRWRRAAWGFGLWIGVWLLWTGFDMIAGPEQYERVFEPEAFAKTLPIALLLLPLQVLFEEALTRGYLLQQFTAVTRMPWLSVVFVALVFAALHLGNAEAVAHGTWATLAYYATVGLLLGGLTIVDDGLELACGVHFAANLSAALLVNAPETSLPTPSLYIASAPSLTHNFIGLALGGLVLSFWLWRSQIKPGQIAVQEAAHHVTPV